MKNKTLTFGIMIIIMGLLSIASTVMNALVLGTFQGFEIFYYICIALSLIMLSMARKYQPHLVASILVFALGFFVNSFIWALQEDGAGQILNFMLTGLIFVASFALVHEHFVARYAKSVSTFFSILLIAMIMSVAIYNLFVELPAAETTLAIACIVVKNIALMATELLPVCFLLYTRTRTSVTNAKLAYN